MPLSQTCYLWVGSKDQILKFFESVGICDGTKSTARSSLQIIASFCQPLMYKHL